MVYNATKSCTTNAKLVVWIRQPVPNHSQIDKNDYAHRDNNHVCNLPMVALLTGNTTMPLPPPPRGIVVVIPKAAKEG